MTVRRRKSAAARQLLLGVLRKPDDIVRLQAGDWDLLLRLLRHTRLKARIAELAIQSGLGSQLPEKVLEQFAAARTFVSQRQRMAQWEVNRILKALEGMDIPVILLKGGAYILAGLPPARGRLLSDVDLLVPRASLEQVEQALQLHGWNFVKLEEYDQRYYRAWMHELPPLRHPERGMEVDIHHTIAPLTSRLSPDPEQLIAESIPLDGSRLRVLQPVDMVLHSAVHLFSDGEFINGLRDLVDLGDLLEHFGRDEAFWDNLLERAAAQGLGRPLFYTLHFTQRLLESRIPLSVMHAIRRHAPSMPVRKLMDSLVEAAIIPDHPDYPGHWSSVARWLLYVRSHWLRMPPGLLLKHLGRKLFMRWKQGKATRAAAVQQ
jgi:hypothetical protein